MVGALQTRLVTRSSRRSSLTRTATFLLRGITLGLIGVGACGLLALSFCSSGSVRPDLIGLDEAELLRRMGSPTRDSRVELKSPGNSYWLAFGRGDHLLVVYLTDGAVVDVEMWSR